MRAAGGRQSHRAAGDRGGPDQVRRSFTATTTQTGVYAASRPSSPTPSVATSTAWRPPEQQSSRHLPGDAEVHRQHRAHLHLQHPVVDRDPRHPAAPDHVTAAGRRLYGTNPQNGQGITFSVSSGRTRLQNISIPFVGLTCAPPGDANPTEPLGIAAASLKPDGSFAATTTQTATYPVTRRSSLTRSVATSMAWRPPARRGQPARSGDAHLHRQHRAHLHLQHPVVDRDSKYVAASTAPTPGGSISRTR